MSILTLLLVLVAIGVILWLVNTYIPMDGKMRAFVLAACAKADKRIENGCRATVPLLEAPSAGVPSCPANDLVIPQKPKVDDFLTFRTADCGQAPQIVFSWDEGWRVEQVSVYDEQQYGGGSYE